MIFPISPYRIKSDELAKNPNPIQSVIPAKAGIQLFPDVLDPGFRRGDAPRDFLRSRQISFQLKKAGRAGGAVLNLLSPSCLIIGHPSHGVAPGKQ
jgi:hypothetical protein